MYCSLLKETILNAKKDAPQNSTDEKAFEEKKIEISNVEQVKDEEVKTTLN